jgi:hypothetical protein
MDFGIIEKGRDISRSTNYSQGESKGMGSCFPQATTFGELLFARSLAPQLCYSTK